MVAPKKRDSNEFEMGIYGECSGQTTLGVDHLLQGQVSARHPVETSVTTGAASRFAVSQHQEDLPVASVVSGKMLKGTLADLLDQPTDIRLMVIQGVAEYGQRQIRCPFRQLQNTQRQHAD